MADNEIRVVQVGTPGPAGVGYSQVTSAPAVSSSNVTPGGGVSFLVNTSFVGSTVIHILGAHRPGNVFTIMLNTSGGVSDVLIKDGAGGTDIQFSSDDATLMTNLTGVGRMLWTIYDDGSNYIGFITTVQ